MLFRQEKKKENYTLSPFVCIAPDPWSLKCAEDSGGLQIILLIIYSFFIPSSLSSCLVNCKKKNQHFILRSHKSRLGEIKERLPTEMMGQSDLSLLSMGLLLQQR